MARRCYAVSSNLSALIKQCSQITTDKDQGESDVKGILQQVGPVVSAALPGTGGEHLGSVMGQLEVEEDIFEEDMSEEERGGPVEELEKVVIREENPPKTVKIGSTLAPEHKAVLQKGLTRGLTIMRILGGFFLGGESAGANIAHFVAIRAGSTIMGLAGLKIEGLVMVHPFFGANKEHDKIIEMYKFMCLSSTECDDDPTLNP
ncbi:hypothetical protein LWI29_017490 [Acer saccharum]|uniref:Alpha/beta hydrolase fold-3 domain-containing protein n=1 Tax=Acer saccharum TaxID=4024 RepID=A0AA39RX82_ACESA|nr:hypothetical protein LWI29_017490 [Acer saccharum]